MRHWKVGSVSLLIAVFALAGCAKKSTEQASITGTGFDSATTEELAQLPQQASTASQQAGVEVLPIETSPITQGVPPIAGPTSSARDAARAAEAASAVAGTLTRDQQIQTALKNAGIYNGAIDGKIGPASKRAIEEFQRRNNLKADGKVGPKTWAALEQFLSGAGQAPTPIESTSTANADQ